MLGLCRNAGQCVSGSDSCLQALKKNKVSLMIVSRDASDNTKKRMQAACRNAGVLCIEFGEKEMLGKMSGKEQRSTIAVCDGNFARGIMAKMETLQNGGIAE
ncbi:MAG: ribosomal L7Ae/L30e/S12e/Gadd45 family protein [Clostridia bacterium]